MIPETELGDRQARFLETSLSENNADLMIPTTIVKRD